MSISEKGEEFPSGPKAGDRTTSFFDDPMIDELLRAVTNLTMELSITRERLQTVEILLQEKSHIDRAAIDDASLNLEIEQERAADRAKLIESILGPIVARLERT